MSNADLNRITNFIWGIADDALRDLYVRGKYRDVILPMMVQAASQIKLAGSGGVSIPRSPLDVAGFGMRASTYAEPKTKTCSSS